MTLHDIQTFIEPLEEVLARSPLLLLEEKSVWEDIRSRCRCNGMLAIRLRSTYPCSCQKTRPRAIPDGTYLGEPPVHLSIRCQV
jgi:hypothetical protein